MAELLPAPPPVPQQGFKCDQCEARLTTVEVWARGMTQYLDLLRQRVGKLL